MPGTKDAIKWPVWSEKFVDADGVLFRDGSYVDPTLSTEPDKNNRGGTIRIGPPDAATFERILAVSREIIEGTSWEGSAEENIAKYRDIMHT
ncbi:hypothetical protein VKT23_004674 [Stygiomarasmius scandens]|uniref:Uncharacterized protein n=1 Tax=Marasmiellus scandens TaxID=2682957 RepID=A0ABR1JXN0_9AGAR